MLKMLLLVRFVVVLCMCAFVRVCFSPCFVDVFVGLFGLGFVCRLIVRCWLIVAFLYCFRCLFLFRDYCFLCL